MAAPIIGRMVLSVADLPVWPLTADDVMRMVDAGILEEDAPVELLAGVLTQVSPKSPEHGTVIARLVRWLIVADPSERYEVRTEHPLAVPDRQSLPEPDVAVVTRSSAGGHPPTARLVIEVAVSSLVADTHVKPVLYAAARVPEYWVVDVVERRLEVFTGPGPDGYAAHRTASAPARVQPVAADLPPLDLGALLAGL